MSGVNKVILIGNLGKDPEMFTFANGSKKARLLLATSEIYKSKTNERTEHTEWHSVILYRGLAEIAEKFLKKGNSIYIEGKLRTRFWDEEGGERHYVTEIEAQNLTMLGGAKKQDSSGVTKGDPATPSIPSVPDKLEKDENFYDPSDDALPF